MGLKRALLRCLPTSTNRLRRAAAQSAAETLPPEMLARIDAVPGCLNLEQGTLLYHLAVHSPPQGGVVEIGSFLGRSTLWLACGTRRANGGPVVAIDPHTGHERPDVRPELDSFTSFLGNIREAGVSDWVRPIREPSQQVAAKWCDPIRFLWVDGSHSYEDVLADLQGFVPHVVPGGYIALHDTRGRRFPGVRRAMLEYFTGNTAFERVALLRNMAVYRKRDDPSAACRSSAKAL